MSVAPVRRILPWVLKIGLAVGIMVFMLATGRLDLSQMAAVRHAWPELALVAALFGFTFLCAAVRWRILLASQGIAVSVPRAFALSMIGIVFNTVIPGSVSGDLVKAYYIGKSVDERRARAVATILVDRVVGLVGLLIVASVAGFLQLETISRDPRATALLGTVVTSALLGVIGIVLTVLVSEPVARLVDRLAVRLKLLRVLSEMVRSMAAFRHAPAALLWALLVGWPGQLAGCFIFYVLASVVEPGAVPLAGFLLIVPLGYTVMALPVAPLGIGVGQAAFFWLFELVQPGTGVLGTSVCTVYQISYLLASLTGLVFYLLERPARSP